MVEHPRKKAASLASTMGLDPFPNCFRLDLVFCPNVADRLLGAAFEAVKVHET
jgi:hypothetical protein